MARTTGTSFSRPRSIMSVGTEAATETSKWSRRTTGANFAHHIRDDLRLYAKEDDVGVAHRFRVIGSGVHFELVLE